MVFLCFSSAVMFTISIFEMFSLFPLKFKKTFLALDLTKNRARKMANNSRSLKMCFALSLQRIHITGDSECLQHSLIPEV